MIFVVCVVILGTIQPKLTNLLHVATVYSVKNFEGSFLVLCNSKTLSGGIPKHLLKKLRIGSYGVKFGKRFKANVTCRFPSFRAMVATFQPTNCFVETVDKGIS